MRAQGPVRVVFERIICGVGGSPEGLEALRQSLLLRAPEGRLLAVTVCETHLAVRTGFEAARWVDKLRMEAQRASDEARREIGGLEAAETSIVEGHAVASLLAIAEREQATLLAVGTHERSRAAGALLGSVATSMLHDAPCPVLIARASRAHRWRLRRVVVGADGSPQSLLAATLALELARRFGSELRMVAARGGKPLDLAALDRLGDLEVVDDHPVGGLVTASERADLLVVGARGLHGLRSLGSVSERVAHQAHCSVLVVRPTA